MDAYTETSGGFPARFDARQDKSTGLRLGLNAVKPLTDGLNLVGTLEAAPGGGVSLGAPGRSNHASISFLSRSSVGPAL